MSELGADTAEVLQLAAQLQKETALDRTVFLFRQLSEAMRIVLATARGLSLFS
jgi:hypothetical protein